jgi:hypothetical protein
MNEIETARAAVNAETFGTPAWEAAMQVVRNLVAQADASRNLRSMKVRLVPKGRKYQAVAR